MKESFILYTEQSELVNELTDIQAGQLLKAIYKYAQGEEVALDGIVKLAFIPIRQQIDRNNEKYEAFKEKQSENGKKGGRPKKEENPSLSEKNPKNPSLFSETQKSLNDNVNVNENVNENVLSYESKEKKESELSDFIDPKIDFFKSSQKTDPFVLADKVKEEYKAVIGKDCFLNQMDIEKLTSLYLATPDFFETLNGVMWQLKALQDLWKAPKPIGLGFSPPFSWLLKDNFKNYSDIRNGVYEEQVAKWRKEYRLKRSQELAKQLEAEEKEVCCG